MLKRLPLFLIVVAIALFSQQVLASQYEDASAKVGDTAPSRLNQLNPLEAVLYDNGPLVTNPGAGVGGADVSLLSNLTLGENILGYGHALASGFRVADDFTVPAGPGWNVDSIRFYAYQSFAGSNTINNVNLRIWDGDPSLGTSNVVFGDTTTNRLSTSGFANTYRMSETVFPNNTDRHVQANDVTVGTTLAAGTYWLDWQTGGTAASGPWAPPTSYLNQTNAPGANGMQFDPTAGVWNPAIDSTSLTPDDFPFVISGTMVPEPASALLLLLGAVGILAVRRR